MVRARVEACQWQPANLNAIGMLLAVTVNGRLWHRGQRPATGRRRLVRDFDSRRPGSPAAARPGPPAGRVALGHVTATGP